MRIKGVMGPKLTGVFAIAAGLNGSMVEAGPAPSVEATPLSAYGSLPTLDKVDLSPDGHAIAFVKNGGDEQIVMIYRMGQQAPTSGIHLGDLKLRSLLWMDDDHLLITMSTALKAPVGFTGPLNEWFLPQTYEISKNKLTPMQFSTTGARISNIIWRMPSIREVNGAAMAYVGGYDENWNRVLYKYRASDHQSWIVATAHEPYDDWLVDAAGNIAADYTYSQHIGRWKIRVQHDGYLVDASSGTAAIDFPEIIGFDPTGASLYVEFVEQGSRVWKPLSLKDGGWGAPLAKGAPFSDTFIDRLTGHIVGGQYRTVAHTENVFFDPELQAHWDAISRAFPGEIVEWESNSDDFSKIVVKVQGVKDGYSYQLFDWYTHKITFVGNVYQGIKSLAEVKAVTYPAADGLPIPAALTLPAGREAKGLPLVMLPHGGPAAVDEVGFDWWAQAYAAQGYAVLQPNYRGSSIDNGFMEAGYGEWGRKMQSDLSDGVRYLAQQGIIDPKRVCIVGASYGGYAALAGVTLEPAVYRCAVAVAGIGDLKQMLFENGPWNNSGNSFGERYWDRFVGVSGSGDPKVAALSPVDHVDAITAPVLLIHGTDDTVVPFDQSKRVLAAMKRAGKPVELVTLKNEDHWLSRGETRLQMLEASVAFLKTNNPPDP